MRRLPRCDVGLEDAPLREALREALEGVLARGRYVGGPEAEAFEQALVATLDPPGERAGVGVGSGTDAITLALLALGVGPGDEVITVANAGVPGPTAIRRTGAEVVFCDVCPDTCLMDPRSAASVASPRTSAILAVHLYGSMVDVDALRVAASGIPIVEDCAQAYGSRLRGRAAGTLGELAAFSFYPTKNLGALGDAGFVAGRPELVARARRLRDYGRDESGVAVELGMMSRLDELQAAALRVKLARAHDVAQRRRACERRYAAALPEHVRRVRGQGEAALHLLVVRLAERSRVAAALAERGIDTGVHYPVAAHRMPAFSECRRAALPETERACDEVLSLPFFPSMSPQDVERVCAALETIC